MTKFIVSIMTLAMAAGLAIAPSPALAKHGDHDNMMGNHRRCPRGSHWVPAHRGPNGRWIPGHCQARRY